MRTDAVDVALCMHVLYHVPDQAAAAAELRRIVRPGGHGAARARTRVDHVREIDDLVAEVTGARPGRAMLVVQDGGRRRTCCGTAFDVGRAPPTCTGALDVTDADAVVAYVARRRPATGRTERDDAEPRRDPRPGRRRSSTRDGAFVVTTVSGCFVCR